jgi:hypothetical protein
VTVRAGQGARELRPVVTEMRCRIEKSGASRAHGHGAKTAEQGDILQLMTCGWFQLRWWLLLFVVSAPVRGEAYYLMPREPSLLLEEGWWRGTVALAHGPAEFFMEVRGTDVETARIVMHSEFNAIELSGLAQHARRIVIPGGAPGERLEGRYSNGAFFGRYHPGEGAPEEAYSFWAERSRPWEDTPPVKVWNLTGTWILSFGPMHEVEVVLAHRNDRLHGLWREAGGTVRYFAGLIEGKRFSLASWHGGQTMAGSYETGGCLRGEFTDTGGAQQGFTMRRKLPVRLAAQAY